MIVPSPAQAETIRRIPLDTAEVGSLNTLIILRRLTGNVAEDWPRPSRVFLKGGHPGKHTDCIMFMARETRNLEMIPHTKFFYNQNIKILKINHRNGGGRHPRVFMNLSSAITNPRKLTIV